MERKLRPTLLLVVTLVGGMPMPAWAQATPAEVNTKFDALLKEKWTTQLEAEAKKAGLTVTDRRLTGTAEQKTAVYTAVVNALNADTTLEKLFDRAYIQALIDERTESRMPTSTNATSTNPATGSLPERSGSTALAALSADLSSLVSADSSAVSINLNALAFVTLRDPETFTEMKNYQAHDFARRFSGTLVFGAKIPEKEITGLSNLPDFDKILDAFSWDLKVRVLGDKDPRSQRWQTLTVGKGGMLVQQSAVILTFIGVTARPDESPAQALEDITIVRGILDPQLALGIAEIKKRIARSPQLSFKAAGTHLTKETGKNKYSYAALFDVGFGPSDFTANVQYSRTNDVSLGVEKLFDTKIWTISADLTSHLAPDSIVQGRTLDWSLGASGNFFQDKAALPVPTKDTWKIFTRVEVPVRGGGKIPVSVIYSNDPNALTKQKYVSGLVGISYDFSALKQLFTPGP